MQYFPLFVNTQALRILLVGAGDVASRKLDLLSRTLADISVIAPDVCEHVLAYAQNGRITLFQREVQEDDIADIDLLYLATANDALNEEMAMYAKAQGIWVNVVDSPSLCRFITPSIVDRGRLLVAISTAGAAPVFARELRSKIETLLPHSLKPLFDFIAERRGEVQQRLPVFGQRKLFWEQFFKANGDSFDSCTLKHYENTFNHLVSDGEILLIDDQTPLSLLPIAAMPLMQRLDLICSDVGLPDELLELCRRDASRGSLLPLSLVSARFEKGERLLIYADTGTISTLAAHFPMAKQIRAGSL